MEKTLQEKKKNVLLNNIEDSKTIIKVSNLWKSFKTRDGGVTVLKNITKEIKEGEFVILFGPSGCGKTTLLNTIMGLEHPDKGDVNLQETDIWSLTSDERALVRKENIGFVPQQQNWVKSLNVIENIQLVGYLLGYSSKESKKKALEKLELVGMSHRADYRPTELSSGEQQRISVARCLMNDPKIIVADEPTGNLDVKAGILVMEVLRKLANSGTAVLTVTHNPESLSFADRIFFMLDGKIRGDVRVRGNSIKKIKEEINKDLYKFIDDIGIDKQSLKDEKAPPITSFKESKAKKGWLNTLIIPFLYPFVFLFTKLFSFVFYLPIYLFEVLLRRSHDLSSNVLAKGEAIISNGVGKSITDWQIAFMSFRNLMFKKSRTFVTVAGIGVGIGFVTLLLSVGYGLENLVVDEIAKIEQRNQIEVFPITSSEIFINQETADLIGETVGIERVYPLMNAAATMYYQDSQAAIVVYGTESEYFNVTGEIFRDGGEFSNSEVREVVVSEEVVQLLGISEESAVGKTLSLGFIPVGEEIKDESLMIEEEEVPEVIDLLNTGEEQLVGEETETETETGDSSIQGALDEKNDRITSKEEEFEYTIVGVVGGHHAPIVFIDIDDLKGFGEENYSSLLLTLEETADIARVRQDIEYLGMRTVSVMDTISEVQEFFQTFRLVLAIIGFIAFFVAVLGMFNTLTVSLLERIREIGLLKIIGMRSAEVRKLFITEAILISLTGGFFGIFLGMVMGGVISLIVSIISISNGGDYILVSMTPIYIIFGILIISFLIGLLTGFYPSKKAVKISPLDALRYE